MAGRLNDRGCRRRIADIASTALGDSGYRCDNLRGELLSGHAFGLLAEQVCCIDYFRTENDVGRRSLPATATATLNCDVREFPAFSGAYGCELPLPDFRSGYTGKGFGSVCRGRSQLCDRCGGRRAEYTIH